MTSHLARYRRIADTLRRHGLGYLAGVLGVDRWIPFHRGALGHERRDQPYLTPEHLRLALEELGPTFVKLGQLLSTRAELLPPEYLTELVKLQDAAPPVDPGAIRAAIVEELGDEPEELFREFEIQPLASASIGQAHAATLLDGTPVVVKVRRPGAVATVEEDLEILHNLAAWADRRWDAARDYDLPAIADEFARTLRAELDYLQEARNAQRFADNFADDPTVLIPRVVWDRTTSRVLTLERMTGIKVDDLDGLDAAGIDRKTLARKGADLLLGMIFDDRFFHGDPHPGNLFVLPDGRMALIDFGMVGRLDEERRGQLVDFLAAFTRADPDALTSALVGLSVRKQPVDRDDLRESLSTFVTLYKGRALGEIDFAHLLTELFTLLRHHRLRLPSDTALLFKVLLMAEGMGERLDPQFGLSELLTPYAEKLIRERYSPAAVAQRLAQASVEGGRLLVELPERLRRVLDTFDTGGVQVHLRASELDPLMGRAERIGNRLVAGMVAAALINGVGQLVTSDRKWRSWESALMSAGMGAVGILGAYLLWTGRRRRGNG